MQQLPPETPVVDQEAVVIEAKRQEPERNRARSATVNTRRPTVTLQRPRFRPAKSDRADTWRRAADRAARLPRARSRSRRRGAPGGASVRAPSNRRPAGDPYVVGKTGERLHLDQPPRARPPAGLEEHGAQRELLRAGQHGHCQILDQPSDFPRRRPDTSRSRRRRGRAWRSRSPRGAARENVAPGVLQPFQIGAQQLLQHPARVDRHAAQRGDAEHTAASASATLSDRSVKQPS